MFLNMRSFTVLKFAVSCLLSAIFIQQTQAQVTPAPVCESTGHRCINTNQCNGLANGNYQWCGGCEYQVRCQNNVGELFGAVNPPYNQWDDNRKNFELVSATCVECYTPCPPGPSAPTVPVCEKTGLGCLSTSCTGGPGGNFQFCGNCSYYATCATLSTAMTLVACGSGTVFDDFTRTCQATSTTCRECYDTCYPPTTVLPTEAEGGPGGSTEAGGGPGGPSGSTEAGGDGGENAGNELRTGLIYCSFISLLFALSRMLV